MIEDVRNYQNVSFDIFDTLIVRNVQHPTDIFKLVEKDAYKQFNSGVIGFSDKRVKAEKELRNRLYTQSRSGKVALEEITYDEIYESLKSDYDQEQLTYLKEKELEYEMLLCAVNEEVLSTYEFCISNGKTVSIISDMYLPAGFLIKMLKKVGITGYHRIVVSSEVGLCKATGSLYRWFLREESISPDQLIHIGDNPNSDIRQAANCGIKTVQVKKTSVNNVHSKLLKSRNIECNVLYSFINNNISRLPAEKRLGFECMGPLLFGFSKWLHDSVRLLGIHDIYFLSRDGQVMKKAFDALYSEDKDVRTHYFYASRIALQEPLMSIIQSYQDFLSRLHWPPVVNVSYFLKAMGIRDFTIIEKVCQESQITEEYSTKRENLRQDSVFRKLYDISRLVIHDDAEQKCDCFLEYVKQEHMLGRVAIVDIGWHGNMQRNMNEIFKHFGTGQELYGFYIGVYPDENHSESQYMRGYIFDKDANYSIYDKEKEINTMFEQIFLADHGSVKSYIKDNGRYNASLFEYEQTDEKVIRQLVKYQEGALEFIDMIKPYGTVIDLSGEDAVNNVLDQFINPLYEEVIQWLNVTFKDVDDYKIVIQPRHPIYYIFHPRKLIKEYRNSIWKIGYLKLLLHGDYNYLEISRMIKRARTYMLARGAK